MYIFKANFKNSSLNSSFSYILFNLIFLFISINLISASSIGRNEEMNHDFICANHAFDTADCQNYAKEKWGYKKDEKSLCCLLVEVQDCIFKRKQEYCRGEMMEAFRRSYLNEVNHIKSTKCKNYSTCEEEFEIWTLAAMIMLCLISGMACITLGVLYTKK